MIINKNGLNQIKSLPAATVAGLLNTTEERHITAWTHNFRAWAENQYQRGISYRCWQDAYYSYPNKYQI